MTDTINLAAGIAAAYVTRNRVAAADVPLLLTTLHGALCGLRAGSVGAGATPAPTPALERPSGAQIRKSIRPDGLVSFVDGRSYKTLKRHLRTHGLDPASYRARFGLPADYPMAAPDYAARRAEIAREIGLGRYGSMARRTIRQAAE